MEVPSTCYPWEQANKQNKAKMDNRESEKVCPIGAGGPEKKSTVVAYPLSQRDKLKLAGKSYP